jgi:hypothetical protein
MLIAHRYLALYFILYGKSTKDFSFIADMVIGRENVGTP